MEESEHHFTVVVLGAGTAGTHAARAAKEAGATVALVYEPPERNLCIQRGCMPSKSLLAAAHAHHLVNNAEPFGVSISGGVTAHVDAILKRKDAHVERFDSFSKKAILEGGYTLFEGHAQFLPEKGGLSIATKEGNKVIQGERYVIATGSKAFIPPIPGLDQVSYITSDDIMYNRVTEIPESLLILGGGPIGLEMATFFASVGTAVTILERGELMGAFDPEFGEEMKRALKDLHNITIVAPGTAEKIEKTETGITVHVATGTETKIHSGSMLLLATGRAPAVDGLGLEHLGLTVEKGEVLTCDATMCTANKNVYAAGDVTKDLQILHVAAREGEVAGYNAAVGTGDKTLDYDALKMLVTFTNPPFAHVGLTEKEAKEKGHACVTHTINFAETGRAIVMGVQHGIWKLIVSGETGKILGSSILGPRADDLIHEVYLAMELDATVEKLASLITYHPTLSEQFGSLVSNCAQKMKS